MTLFETIKFTLCFVNKDPENKSTTSEPEVAREPNQPVKSSPLKVNMMMPSDLHSELSKKLSKTRSNAEQVISSSSLKSEEQVKPQQVAATKQPVGKLDPSKTDKIKIEMRLPGMVPPGAKMALPGLHGKIYKKKISI